VVGTFGHYPGTAREPLGKRTKIVYHRYWFSVTLLGH
jgi:hypothetical protein